MVTFWDADEDVLAAFAAGADDYITKPVHAGQLHARIMAGFACSCARPRWRACGTCRRSSRSAVVAAASAMEKRPGSPPIAIWRSMQGAVHARPLPGVRTATDGTQAAVTV
jgi:CheY-like chemotaxis protein